MTDRTIAADRFFSKKRDFGLRRFLLRDYMQRRILGINDLLLSYSRQERTCGGGRMKNRAARVFWIVFCLTAMCAAFAKTAAVRRQAELVRAQADQAEADQAEAELSAGLSAAEPGRAAEKKQAALTFDDGPHPVCTPKLLDGLKARGILATFFIIGENAEQHPEIVRRAAEEGHLIGNHTYHHAQLNTMSEEQACQEVEAASQLLEELTGSVPLYLRPPFGAWSRKKDCPQELISVYWDIDPLDWKDHDADRIVREVCGSVKDGSIILLHDIYPESVEAALRIADTLTEEGYEFVPVEELFFD